MEHYLLTVNLSRESRMFFPDDGSPPVVLDGYKEDFFPAAIAKAFKAQYPDDINVIELSDREQEIEDETKYKWVSNLSGDPDAPTEYKRKLTKPKLIDGVMRDSETISFDKRDAFRYRRTVLGPEFSGPMVKDEKTGRTIGTSYDIIIPPYSRIKLEAPVADWIVSMEQQLPIEHGQRLAVSHEPSPDDPSPEWSYMELREWLFLANPAKWHTNSIPTLDALKAKLKKDNPKFNEMAMEKALYQAKVLLYRRCFMIFGDASKPIPSAKAFKNRMFGGESGERPVMASDVEKSVEAILGIS